MRAHIYKLHWSDQLISVKLKIEMLIANLDLLQMNVPRPPENHEEIWKIERDMVDWSPVKNYAKLQISVENPWF